MNGEVENGFRRSVGWLVNNLRLVSKMTMLMSICVQYVIDLGGGAHVIW